jgi:hypothetical protein
MPRRLRNRKRKDSVTISPNGPKKRKWKNIKKNQQLHLQDKVVAILIKEVKGQERLNKQK